MIPGIVEQSWKSYYVIKTREVVTSVSVPISAVGVVIYSCKDYAPAGSTGSRRAKRIGENHSILRQSVQMRG